jgi:hypothetical protein
MIFIGSIVMMIVYYTQTYDIILGIEKYNSIIENIKTLVDQGNYGNIDYLEMLTTEKMTLQKQLKI